MLDATAFSFLSPLVHGMLVTLTEPVGGVQITEHVGGAHLTSLI